MSNAALTWGERRLLASLGLPSLGLAMAVTTVASLFPVLAQDSAGPGLAGAPLALEGVFALVLPSLVGAWSDGTSSRIGGRLPFVLVATPIMVLLPLVSGIFALAGALAVFFVGYYAYFSPHFALYLDLVPDRMRGRSQGIQNTLREVGLGVALIGGALLFSGGRALAFLVAAAVLLACTAVLVAAVRGRSAEHQHGEKEGQGSFSERLRSSRDLLREHPQLTRLLVANALWETALNALRAFVVVFFIQGIGRSPAMTSLVFGIVAAMALVAAPVSGWLADKLGELTLLRWALLVYAPGVIVPAFFQQTWVIAIVPIVAFAAVTVMTLPFSLLMGYLPEGEHGGASGLFGISRGSRCCPVRSRTPKATAPSSSSPRPPSPRAFRWHAVWRRPAVKGRRPKRRDGDARRPRVRQLNDPATGSVAQGATGPQGILGSSPQTGRELRDQLPFFPATALCNCVLVIFDRPSTLSFLASA